MGAVALSACPRGLLLLRTPQPQLPFGPCAQPGAAAGSCQPGLPCRLPAARCLPPAGAERGPMSPRVSPGWQVPPPPPRPRRREPPALPRGGSPAPGGGGGGGWPLARTNMEMLFQAL